MSDRTAPLDGAVQRSAPDIVGELAAELSNWGRWGADDERGTVNYITPSKVAAAARLVTTGEIVELGVPLERRGPATGHPRRFAPLHFMTALPGERTRPGGLGVADDVLTFPLQAGTQWDALAHVSYRGRIYGGRPTSVVTSEGAAECSIRGISGHIATRGVLLDLARDHPDACLPPGHAIDVAALDACLSRQHTDVGEGDVILLRTGFLERCRRDDWRGYHGDMPGLSVWTLRWLHEHRVAAVATDTSFLEVRPSEIPGEALPFHSIAIPHMGLLLGEIFDLEELAARCARDGRYEFLFVAPPLPVTGGVGSPVNPYAIR